MSKNCLSNTETSLTTVFSESEYSNAFLMLALTSCVGRDLLKTSELAIIKKHPDVYDVQKRYVSIKNFDSSKMYSFLKDEGVFDRAIVASLHSIGLDVEDTKEISELLGVGLSFYDAVRELFVDSFTDYTIWGTLVPFLKEDLEGILGTLRSRVFVTCWLNGMCFGDVYGFSVPVFMATVGTGLFALLDIRSYDAMFSNSFLDRLDDETQAFLFDSTTIDMSFIVEEVERIIKEVDLCREK